MKNLFYQLKMILLAAPIAAVILLLFYVGISNELKVEACEKLTGTVEDYLTCYSRIDLDYWTRTAEYRETKNSYYIVNSFY